MTATEKSQYLAAMRQAAKNAEAAPTCADLLMQLSTVSHCATKLAEAAHADFFRPRDGELQRKIDLEASQ